MTIHALAEAALAFGGNQSRLVVLSDEIVEVMVGLKDHIPTASAVAAARPALGDILLALKGDTAFAAVACSRINFDFVDKHGAK